MAFWDREQLPLLKVLEENMPQLRKDARRLLKRKKNGWDDTYASLGAYSLLVLTRGLPIDLTDFLLRMHSAKG